MCIAIYALIHKQPQWLICTDKKHLKVVDLQDTTVLLVYLCFPLAPLPVADCFRESVTVTSLTMFRSRGKVL